MGQSLSRHHEAPQQQPQPQRSLSPPPAQPRPLRRRMRGLGPVSAIFADRRPEMSEQPSSSRRNRISRLLPDISHLSIRDHDDPQLLRTPSPPRRRRLTRARNAVVSHTPGLSQRRISRIDTVPRLRRRNSFGNISPDRASFRPSAPHLPEVDTSPEIGLHFENSDPPNSESASSPDRRRSPTGRSMSNIADRISGLTPARRDISRLTASIRRRRARRGPADENAAMLTRLLSVAAAATAASLMGGDPETAVNDLRHVATDVDSDDGTFDGFLQALRSGRLAMQLGENANANHNTNANTDDQNPAPLDFFRMFRFAAAGSRQRANMYYRPSSSRSGANVRDTTGENRRETEAEDERMVPVLIVGIRALNNEQEPRPDENDAMPSFIDSLQHLPSTINIGLSSPAPDGDQAPQRRSPLRFGHRRRASMGGLGLFSGSREGSRRHGLSDRPRPRSEIGPSTASSTPPGPYAPPTTPSSPPLSSVPSGSSTPSGIPRPPTPRGEQSSNRDSLPSRAARTSVLDPTAEEPAIPRMTRNRRLSESDFMRHRSGSTRRNGIVEPEHPLDREGNRSWIIYVLGGSYPENHPILSTPSLFTEHPTYEDMLLLSSLLGSVKPPVATAEDLANAGGLFTVTEIVGNDTIAQDADGDEIISLTPSRKCPVCITEYELREVARRLKACGHCYHRECIDEWLTNGRNSCPLCRGQGVDEKPSEDSTGEGPSSGLEMAEMNHD